MSEPSNGPADSLGLARWFFVVPFLILCWLGMQIVHESGHVLAAWGSGARVTRVVSHPFAISRTDVESNSFPLVITWGGPVAGALLPLVLWGFTSLLQHSTTHLWRFFAGFCLVTNGLYLAVGVWWGVGDAGDLVRQGSPSWTLLAFGVATVPLGFALWNGQSGSFGLGPHPQPVSWRQAWTAWCVLIATLVAEFQFSG